MKNDKENAEKGAKEIFDGKKFGPKGEWKKLDGTCLDKDTGEYVLNFAQKCNAKTHLSLL